MSDNFRLKVLVWTAMGLGACLYGIGFSDWSFWGDEVNIIQSGGHASIMEHVTQGYSGLNITALSRLPQDLMIHWFGPEEWAVRLPSVLFGLVNILLVYVIGKEFVGREIGVLAALMFALNPYVVYLTKDGRGYSIIGFFFLVGYVFLGKALRDPRWGWWVAFLGWMSGVVFIHLFSLFVLLSVLAVSLILLWMNRLVGGPGTLLGIQVSAKQAVIGALVVGGMLMVAWPIMRHRGIVPAPLMASDFDFNSLQRDSGYGKFAPDTLFGNVAYKNISMLSIGEDPFSPNEMSEIGVRGRHSVVLAVLLSIWLALVGYGLVSGVKASVTRSMMLWGLAVFQLICIYDLHRIMGDFFPLRRAYYLFPIFTVIVATAFWEIGQKLYARAHRYGSFSSLTWSVLLCLSLVGASQGSTMAQVMDWSHHMYRWRPEWNKSGIDVMARLHHDSAVTFSDLAAYRMASFYIQSNNLNRRLEWPRFNLDLTKEYPKYPILRDPVTGSSIVAALDVHDLLNAPDSISLNPFLGKPCYFVEANMYGHTLFQPRDYKSLGTAQVVSEFGGVRVRKIQFKRIKKI